MQLIENVPIIEAIDEKINELHTRKSLLRLQRPTWNVKRLAAKRKQLNARIKNLCIVWNNMLEEPPKGD